MNKKKEVEALFWFWFGRDKRHSVVWLVVNGGVLFVYKFFLSVVNLFCKYIEMDDDNSNDVVLIDNDEDSRPFNSSTGMRPLMSLFERLISNDTKSNTVLTNAQILSILDLEFHMDISKLQDLEIEIYINIVKKFLKDWPQWDVFDRLINKLKRKGANDNIKNILEQKYKHLKEYLNSMIEIATPLAQETLENTKVPVVTTAMETENSDLVLEIYCTRKMLNRFIFNRPHPNQNNSLFNLEDLVPYRLNPTLPHYTFSSLLHWYGVRLSIELPNFQFTRYTTHRLNHTLVNDANGPRQLNTIHDTDVYMKTTKNVTNSIPISGVVSLLDKVIKQYQDKIEYDMVKAIFEVIKTDLYINSTVVEVPGSYKQHSSKYPYVRKLFADVEVDQPSQNNLYIEETITPIQDWHIGKFMNIMMPNLPHLQSWLKFECGECKQKYNGAEFLTLMRDHFKVFHMDEPDWTCTNCKKTFDMATLTDLGWRHEC